MAQGAAIRACVSGELKHRRLMMTHFVGLDVSQRATAICVVDDAGRRVWRGMCPTSPEAIERTIRESAGEGACLGLETGPLTPWLVHALRGRGLEVVCLDARHARAALRLRINKTDQNDAEGLAQVLRSGWYRPVHVKSFDAHRARSLLGGRAQLKGMTTRLSNMIRGVLKTFGLGLGELCGLRFDRRVEGLIESAPEIALIVRPLLTSWRQLREQIAVLDKAVLRQVRADPTCRLLMSVPGVGALTSLAYVSTIEDPARFSRSRAVGAHLGLTPRQYQSGEVDHRGRISRCGDALVRTLLYEAAVTLLCRVKRGSVLRDWALAVARRAGSAKARVALARKLSVLLHAIWRTGQPFRWSASEPAAEAAMA